MIEQICEFPISASCAVEHSEALPPKADVVIVGGGIIGITTAYYLAKAGLKPVVLEKGRVAGEQSARNWGWIRQQGRDLAELPIMIEANQLWKEIAQELDEDIGLTHCGVTYFSSQEAEISRYEDWLKDAVPMGVDSKLLSSRALSDMIPGMSRLYSAALHTASDMKAEPFAAVPAIARAAKRRGAVILENCAARVLDRAGGRVAGVVTERGLIETKEVIVAGGAWSSLFLRNEGVDIPQLSVSATVAATKTLPLIHDGAAAGGKLAFRRRQDGGYTIAASGSHEIFVGWDALRHFVRYLPQLRHTPFARTYRPWGLRGFPDGWATSRRWNGATESPFEKIRVLNPKPNFGRVNDIRLAFETLFPALGKVEISFSWAGMIDTMPDIIPVVDKAPLEGLSICTGMSGHGFGIGPAFGRIMADLVTGAEVGHDLTRFRFSRFSDGSKLRLGLGL
ncbi:NAD(P)/FAD-dependent oxidoreductase [Pseudopelagicola sp. nBUS_20]|uniref:NAD(P)/FAD-dependent oxidoreductase n=1 Tax=Pseudopelagicola sp. nBUS_20 TaxID=3395317 RepID=UPI003EB8F25A